MNLSDNNKLHLPKKIKELFSNLTEKKKLMLLLLVGFAGILLIFISEIGRNDADAAENQTDDAELSLAEYENTLEEKLCALLESIDGAGRVHVMLTLDGGEETVYAVDTNGSESTGTNENNSSSDTNFASEHIIIKSGSSTESGMPLVTLLPKVRGVAVVCDGGDNPLVALSVTHAVAAACGISTAKISVSRMTNNTNGG